MHTNNPYAHAGWPNPRNLDPGSIPQAAHSPYLTMGPIVDPIRQRRPISILTLTFLFKGLEKGEGILNSVVYGPHGHTYLDVGTNSNVTTLIRMSGLFAEIHWSASGTGTWLKAPGVCSPMLASSFLELSPDGGYRIMRFNGNKFFWEAKVDATYMYKLLTDTSTLEIARLEINEDCNAAVLEISMDNFEEGIVQRAIISAVLLYGGRSFD
ncbi:hypothetical protein CPC08DRAFT_768258 [Agrocybe pediades]|nr:hypothetical protein CPC08DRAFT_768258 [Agrocybe pediades]